MPQNMCMRYAHMFISWMALNIVPVLATDFGKCFANFILSVNNDCWCMITFFFPALYDWIKWSEKKQSEYE